MVEITAINFLENSHKNFEIDYSTQKIRSVKQSQRFESNCGWQEGHEWYYEADLQPLLAAVSECLRNQVASCEIQLNGLEIDFPLRIENGSMNIEPDMRSINSARLQILIDIPNHSVMIK